MHKKRQRKAVWAIGGLDCHGLADFGAKESVKSQNAIVVHLFHRLYCGCSGTNAVARGAYSSRSIVHLLSLPGLKHGNPFHTPVSLSSWSSVNPQPYSIMHPVSGLWSPVGALRVLPEGALRTAQGCMLVYETLAAAPPVGGFRLGLDSAPRDGNHVFPSSSPEMSRGFWTPRDTSGHLGTPRDTSGAPQGVQKAY